MRRTFSFNESPVLFILKVLPSLIPGIDKVISVWYSPHAHSLVSHICRLSGQENEISEFQVSEALTVLNRFRLESAPYSWLQKGELPFETLDKGKVQLDIFNEFDNNILMIRILNENDHLQDLFFIYFNQGLGSFASMNPGKFFSTDNKAIIAHLVRNTMLAFFANLKEDQEIFSDFRASRESMLKEKVELKNALELRNKQHIDGIIRLCETFLEELSVKYQKNYQFSDQALQKLSRFDGDFGYLKTMTDMAARQAEIFSSGDSRFIIIEDYHISIMETDETKENEKEKPSLEIPEVPARYNKTLLLLNKLENAALSVRSRNMMITSMNVGNEFPTPITPPAISDALKKHRVKILHLFKEYPEKWEIIRSEFRPIQNILQLKRDSEQLSA